MSKEDAISRERAIEAAWSLLTIEVPAPDVGEAEANLIDGAWSVLFFKTPHPDYVESPGCWPIVVRANGQAEWFDAL
ncbi:MAG: hypothetical protein K2W96_15635 [Gemmataceae bacterium]|nr:hypothetical protein [Gemmataceae bacterium]